MQSASTQTHPTLPKSFNFADDDDIKELKNWCRLHWLYTLSKGISSFNAPTYHDCCLSFSRKGFVKKISHPAIQSASVLKIPSLRNVTSPEEFYEWLRDRLVLHQKLGKKLYFPSINMAHFNTEDEGEDQEDTGEMLNKRVEELSQEQKKTQVEIKRLKDHNHQLLSSSKSWCIKYQELLHQIEDEKASYMEMTPKKILKEVQSKDNFMSF